MTRKKMSVCPNVNSEAFLVLPGKNPSLHRNVFLNMIYCLEIGSRVVEELFVIPGLSVLEL